MQEEKKKNLPKIPELPDISAKELFRDRDMAKEWFRILQKRKETLKNVISSTSASMYSKSGREESKFIIVSPCTDGIYKYQLTAFDEAGPVYDVRRDNVESLLNEIPHHYKLVDIVED